MEEKEKFEENVYVRSIQRASNADPLKYLKKTLNACWANLTS